MDYGRHLISKVVAEGEVKPVVTLGVLVEHFVAPEDKVVYETILDHQQRFGNVPSLATLKMDFPDYRFVKTGETFEFLAEKVRHSYMGAMIEQILSAAVEYYDDGDFVTAKSFLSASLTSLDQSTGTRLMPLDVDAMLVRWKKWRDNPPEGLPYGLKQLDEETRGIQDDDFVVLAGPPGSGKSAFLLNLAISAVRARKKALLITIEMSDDHHMYRAAAHATGIPYKKIKFGPLTDREAEKVDATVRNIVADGRFVIQQMEPTQANMAAVEGLIEQHQPDAIYIDGAYLMDLPGVRRDAQPWEKLSALTRQMRALVLRTGKPVIISTQILRSKMVGGEVSAGSVGYSSSFEQDASVLLGIQPDAELDDRQIIKVLKMRDAPKTSIHLKWDWQTFTYTTPEFEEVEY